ncbi:MAG: hypothetical protein M0R76_09500 [Proteobacteria bacterium]|nr:hypothetical protein [Pseudomonadota bacterium]
MATRVFLVLGMLFTLSALGCGAPPQVASSAEASPPPPATTETPAATPAPDANTDTEGASDDNCGTDAAPEDDKATRAAAFCAREIEKTAEAPVEQLERKQIGACLIALRPEILTDCAQETSRDVFIKIIIASSGEVTNAFAVGDAADTPEAACVVEKVKGVRFPAFSATPQKVVEKFPFKLAR